MTPERLEPEGPRSRVKHSTTEPLRSPRFSNNYLYQSLIVTTVITLIVEEPGFKNVKNKHLGMPPF